MKFKILVDLSLVIISIYLVCLIIACEYRRRFFFRDNTSIFLFFIPNYLPFEWWVMKFNISCLLMLQMLHIKFWQIVKIGPEVLEIDEDVNAWWMTTDTNP